MDNKNNVNNKTIETERLIIRPSRWEDLDTFYEWELLPEVTKFFSIRDNQSKEDVIRKYVADSDDPKARQFTVCLKAGAEAADMPGAQGTQGAPSMPESSEKMIGRIVLADIEDEWKAEIWRIYIADTALRGRGLGREAMLAMMKYCFEDLKLKRLYLDHYTGNPASFLYQSLGFKYEGVLRDNCRKNGKLYDVHLMSMLASEYAELYGNK
ncbi:MAG: GNAT family N-acetyltransferase [Firmicutes bacterium]|nr:GNAT family N-acetyltransferase [Bacillota bacterium]